MARCKEEGKILYLKKMGQRQLTKENRPQIASHFILTNILERATAICIFF
jgi:ribosomal protein S6